MTTELDQVNDTIDRMKRARPWCAKCCEMSYPAAMQLLDTPYTPVMRREMKAAGYEDLSDRAGWGKRCDACATGKRYPWADKLDPQRVLEFVNTDPRCKSTFSLDILKETLTLCRFCDGLDVHQCPGGTWTRPPSENAFSLGSNCEEQVFPGMLDARAYPRDQIGRALEAMYAYELAGSEEGARELLAKALLSGDFSGFSDVCPKCGELDCTKNHAEFM